MKKELGLNIAIGERGYVDHRIRDAADYQAHVHYIHHNPVAARKAHRAEDYAYSSAYPGFEPDPCPQGLKPGSVRIA